MLMEVQDQERSLHADALERGLYKYMYVVEEGTRQ